MRGMLRRYVRKQTFYPDAFGMFINPFFFARRGLMKAMKAAAPKVAGRILDVGCGTKPYKSLFTFTEYIGVDIENPGHDHSLEDIDIYYDGKTLPFDKESFDSVISNQVFEHVFNPPEFLTEIHRVLKPDGKLLLTVPFVWDKHEQPYDFFRFTKYYFRKVKSVSLVSRSNFRILQVSGL